MSKEPSVYTAILYRENSYDDEESRWGNYYDTSDSDLIVRSFTDKSELISFCVAKLVESYLLSARKREYSDHELTLLYDGVDVTEEGSGIELLNLILTDARCSMESANQERLRKEKEEREERSRKQKQASENERRRSYERLRKEFEPDWSEAERRDCTTCGKEGVATLHYNGEPVCEGCHP